MSENSFIDAVTAFPDIELERSMHRLRGILWSFNDTCRFSALIGASKIILFRQYNCLYSQLLAHLQVVDSPNSKGNGQNHSTKAKDQDWSITSIKCRSDTVTNLFRITTAGTRALRASEAGTLFFKKHSSTFSLSGIIYVYVREWQW